MLIRPRQLPVKDPAAVRSPKAEAGQPKVEAAMAALDPLETLSNAIDGIESRYAVHGSFALDGLKLTCGDASVTLPQTRGAQDALPAAPRLRRRRFGHGGETTLEAFLPHHGRR